jgi:DNA invertase Pin-like site-specific DNA recombinase
MKVGYIRISTQEQNEILQADALRDAGCEKFFADPMTGSKFERKGLEQALIYLRSGDILIAWKLPTSSVSHCYAQYAAGARDRLYFAEYAYIAIYQ